MRIYGIAFGERARFFPHIDGKMIDVSGNPTTDIASAVSFTDWQVAQDFITDLEA